MVDESKLLRQLKQLNKKSECTLSIDDAELPDTTNFADDCSLNEQLWKAVMKLGEPDNEIFVRYYRFDEKLKDISKATGLNISTVKSKLSRGKRKLKNCGAAIQISLSRPAFDLRTTPRRNGLCKHQDLEQAVKLLDKSRKSWYCPAS